MACRRRDILFLLFCFLFASLDLFPVSYFPEHRSYFAKVDLVVGHLFHAVLISISIRQSHCLARTSTTFCRMSHTPARSLSVTEEPCESICFPTNKYEICRSIHPKSSRSISSGALYQLLGPYCIVPTRYYRSGPVSNSPKDSTHRTSLTARTTTLGPSVAPHLVRPSAAHDKTLIGLVVSPNGPQKQSSSPYVSPWLRFVFIKLWPTPTFLMSRYSGEEDRRHLSSTVSTYLIWLSDSEFRIMALPISLSLLLPEGNLVLECRLLVPTFTRLGLDYYWQIKYVHCNHQPYALLRDSPDFESLPKSSSLRYEKPLTQHYSSTEKPFPTTSFMDRTLL